MAVIKVFDSAGVKTVQPLENVTDLPYDPISEEASCEPESELEEED